LNSIEVEMPVSPTLLKLIESGRLDPTVFATHAFALADTETAYDTFGAAEETHALKVVLHATVANASAGQHTEEAAPHQPVLAYYPESPRRFESISYDAELAPRELRFTGSIARSDSSVRRPSETWPRGGAR
jgi:hypothetical protein